MNKLQNLLNSKIRYVNLKYSSVNTLRKVNDIVLKSLGRKINLYNKDDIKNLTLDDIKKIDQNVRNKYQKNLVKILTPEIKKITNGLFDKEDLANIRVGTQCKYKQISKSNKIKKVKKQSIGYNPKRPLGNSWYNYPTVPHQDLSSTGFRSSSALIFYFQITPAFQESSLLEIAKFKDKVGLYDVEKEFVLNELNYVTKKKVIKNLNWKIPESIEPGKILLMDTMSLHRSSKINLIPRIALNIKIIPKSLNYIYKIYGLKKKFKKLNNNYNLNVLEKDLDKISESNNAFNYELSILNILKDNFKGAENRLNRLCLFNLTKQKSDTIFSGSLFKLAQEELKTYHFSKFKNRNFKIEKFSCANSILNSFKV